MNITHISDIDLDAKAGGMNTVIPLLIQLQKQVNQDGEISLLLTNDKIDGKYSYKVYDMTSDYKTLLKTSDIVIFHSVYNLRFIPLYLFLRKYNIPYIIVAHGAFSMATQKKGKIRKFLFRNIFLNRFVEDSLAISFLTEDERRNSIYPYKKYIVVPNVIDNKKLISLDTARCDKYILSRTINIVFMSKIDYHHKGIDLLIETLKRMKYQLINENVEFYIYGYGKSKDIDINHIDSREKEVIRLLRDIREYKLEELVKFKGPVFGEAKKDVLQNTDIMILPSRLEGMPLTIIEFLGCGIPCIITKETNMGEFIEKGNAGWVCDFDTISLENTITKAIKDYRKNPTIYKKNAYDTFTKLNSVAIGELSLSKYEELLKEIRN